MINGIVEIHSDMRVCVCVLMCYDYEITMREVYLHCYVHYKL